MEALVFIGVAWVLPIFIAHGIGNQKGRAGLLYGILLGWVGVLILAMLPPKPHVVLELQAEAQMGSTHRECPSCKEPMRRDASVCPHCRNESEPWRYENGVWWKTVDGQWQWLNSQGAWDTRLKTLDA